jgi:ectoine hydroxylase-related dioxygenase (phytanoyl-CoA dioxygenase family)
MDDADEQNGCLWLIPLSHKKGQIQIKHGRDEISELKAIELEVDESLAIPMPMKAGDSLIFNFWMLHKSDGNYAKDRDRRILFLRYADADAVEVCNDNQPRLGRLLRGKSKFDQVRKFEQELEWEIVDT